MTKANTMILDIPAEGIVQTTKEIHLINVRSSDKKVREAIRAKAFELFQQGARVSVVARELQVNMVTVCRWHKFFCEGDTSLLEGERRRGAVSGRQSKLNKTQQQELQQAIKGKIPVDHALPYRRWSFAAVAELVMKKFGLKVSRVTAGKWLENCMKDE